MMEATYSMMMDQLYKHQNQKFKQKRKKKNQLLNQSLFSKSKSMNKKLILIN